MSRLFFWIPLGVALIALVVVIRVKSSRARTGMLLVFGIAAAVVLAETAMTVYVSSLWPYRGLTLEYFPSSHYADDSVLGYAAKPGTTVRALRKRFDSTLYDVTYTISDNGSRITPGNALGATWLFMGCSFTFGEGVEDHETLPAQFSEQLSREANVVNLGLNGYGPHHVLRMLETGRLGGAVSPVTHVIYQALPSHVARAAGRASWGFTDPSYRISGDTVSFAGRRYRRRWMKAVEVLRDSDVGQFVVRRRYGAPPDNDEIELYARIVKQAATLAEKRLGARFTVLFWDRDAGRTTRRVLEQLDAKGIHVVRATSIMTRGELNSMRIRYDTHPTPEAYRRLAAGLVDQLAEPKGRDSLTSVR